MVLSPSEILYLDHSSEDGFNERGLNWATDYSNVKKILNYLPADNENILGIFWVCKTKHSPSPYQETRDVYENRSGSEKP